MSKSDINNTSIAVIGIGCMFPDSKNSNQYWSLIKNKEDAIRAIPGSHWKQEDYFDPDPKKPDMTYGKTGGFLKPVDFDPMEYGVTPNAIEAIDTSQLLGLVVAKQTLEDSGYDKKEFNRDKVGVILGITGAQELVIPLGARLGHPLWKKAIKAEGGDDEFAQNVADRIANGYVQWQEQSFPGLLGNVVSGRIANFFDLGGTNLVVDAACGSSLGAVNMAYMELATKRADMMITGGVDTFNDIFMYMCFSKTPALSSEGNSKPFSADGDGTVLGEGIGMVLLKREEDAIRDGDKIYALIKGVGSGSDGKGAAIFAPQSKGQVKAIRQAYETSGIAPETITLMEAHGTGTKVGDGIELTSMETVYSGADGRSCALGSVKSQIGHCKAAAGAAGLIKSILSLHNKTLPPSTKVNTPLPQLENESFPFYLNTECRPWIADPSHPRRAAVSAFGFGGSNFHCVLEESGKKKEKTDWDYNTQILALEGSSKEELKSQVQKISAIGWEDFCTLANESRQNYRGKANYRLICTVHKTTFDAGKLQESSMLAIEKETSRPYAEGVFFGKGSFDGKISFIFPGQGAQYTGMLRELACTFPDMLGSLELMASSFEKGKSPDIKKTLDDFIYPKYSFGENTLPLLEKELTNTQVAQPALGALSLGAANVLKEFGLSPDYTAGHSYGELAALCAGERLNPEDFCELSVLRGRLMGEGGKDRGTMCAVMADFETLDSLLRKNGIDVVIANRNAPKQMVISGARSEIARAMEILAANSITAKEIPVAAAFHSPLIADAQVPFARKMKRIKLNESQMEVFSNTTALPYPQNCAEASELLAIQLAKPVLFTDEIHAMYEKGARMFIEVGPGARMSGLIKQILSDKNDIFVYSLDSSQGKRSGMTDLALLLSSIAAAGTDVNLSAWAPEIKPEVKAAKRFTVSICGANYVSPRKEIPPANKVYKAVKPGAEQSETDRQPEVKQQPAGGVFAAIQSMQQQTSSLHQQFLENQQQILIALQKMAGVTDLSAVRPALTTQAPVIQHIPQAQTISISPAAAVQQPAAAKKSVSVSGTAAPQNFIKDITAVIAEKTGYPQEMLETSMDMEADLGIDSIKKVEIFSALRDKLPQMPPMASEDMATIRTIDAIIAFLAGAQPPQRTPQQQHANASLIADITAVISEKTGYPQEMLETSMDMEADLGIDSIKKVEIFSALRDKLPQMPPMASEDMATIRTIDAIITFLAGAQPAQQTPQQHANASLIADITAVIAEKTGYPQEMLETSMDMEADLGIDSIKKVEIFSALRDKLPQMPPMASEDMATIRTIDDVESFIKGLVSNNKAAEKAIEVGNAAQGENNCGYREHLQRFVLRLSDTGKERKSLKNNKNTVCILGENSGLNKKIAEVLKQNGAQTIELKLSEFDGSKVKNINGLVIISGQEKAAGNYLLQAFKAVRAIVPPMAKSAAEPFFVTISMLDGTFGLENPGSIKESIYGGLAGLAKTSALEFPAVKCKAIDFAPELSGDETSIKQLAAEILTEGPDEVSISAKGIRRLETVKENQPGILNWPVDKDGVIIVTGGARGVTSECIIHMAEHAPKNNKPHFVLLGRTQLKDEAEWLTALTEETAIKRELMKRMDKPTPAEIGAGFKEIAAGREIRNVLARIRQKGVSADYVTADVRDKKRLTEIFTEIRANNGNISGFIHGAGVLADKKIEDKSDEEFSSVCSTKIDGMKNILDILSEDDLKMIAFFSSSTARFGRKGQIDYSAANEVLNKTAQQQKALRPECKVVSFNWGPWDGGMVNEGLKKLFASEGIGVIPMEDGAHFMFNEMCLSKTADVEVAVIAETPKQYSTIYEREISSENHSVLTDHVIGGKAVLPTALMIELMAHGAMLAKPGEVFCGFDNMRVNSGLKLEPGEQRKYRVSTAQGHEAGGLTYIPVRLESSRDGKVYLLNSSADIILSYEKIKLGKPGLNPQMSQYGHSMEEVYHEKLFHGQALRGIISVDGYSAAAIRGTAKKSPKPSSWIKNPLRSNWIAEPMMLDSSFQLMILWTIENMKKPSLPCFISSYRQEGTVKPETLTVTAKIISQRENTVIADIEFTDKKGNLIAVIKGYECTANESLILPFKANKLPEHSGMALV